MGSNVMYTMATFTKDLPTKCYNIHMGIMEIMDITITYTRLVNIMIFYIVCITILLFIDKYILLSP